VSHWCRFLHYQALVDFWSICFVGDLPHLLTEHLFICRFIFSNVFCKALLFNQIYFVSLYFYSINFSIFFFFSLNFYRKRFLICGTFIAPVEIFLIWTSLYFFDQRFFVGICLIFLIYVSLLWSIFCVWNVLLSFC